MVYSSTAGLAAAQLLRLKERGLHLTVCVEQVAASGGYMMACVADKIVASPFAVLGSIGVLTQIPNVYERRTRAAASKLWHCPFLPPFPVLCRSAALAPALFEPRTSLSTSSILVDSPPPPSWGPAAPTVHVHFHVCVQYARRAWSLTQ